uniref:WD_REPEATS_REGION domain-containing protein n=1 Tax=Heterorhabditis bacteriophora TaxID=37862 RepID=A0A1I7WSS1_HETBA
MIKTARGQFTKTNKDGTEIVPAAISTTEAMLSSEFVPWCSRIFVEPILDLIQREDSVDDFTDRVLTLVNPTDWASFVEEGQRQQADVEFDNLRIKLVAARVPRQAVSLCFSLLRKCIYSTDGDYVNITRYEKSENQLVRRFACNGGNPFTTDKTCSLIVINELSREMLMCGSSTGVIRIWDPSFNIHSHDIEDESHMVTASHPLCDQTRLSTDGRNSTLYDWSQGTGRLICGGNVRVVRIWDAHYERTVQDISIVKKGAATALSGELDTHHLVAIGFRDGSIHVHDTRLPMKESTIMSLHEQSQRIVGVAIRSDGNNRAILAAGSEDGCICVWEPRMYKEPIVDLSLSKESWPQDEMRDFIVHANAQIFGCWMASSQLRVFDISGRSLSSIRQNDFDRGRPLANMSAVAMHKMRCMIAIGSEDGCINVYGQPKTIL